MTSKRMMILLFLGLVFYNLSASQARHISSHHPTAVVVGTVFCDVCHQQEDLSKASHFISGAIVAVECANLGKNSRFYHEVKTNEHGEFSVRLPFKVEKHVKHVIGCSARLISSSEPHCAEASTRAASSSFRLKSRKEGTHIFSAGFFSFKPAKQPKLCNQKPSIHITNNKESYPDHKSLTSTPDDPILTPSVSRFITINQGFLPPLPRLPPLPQLPPLPPLVEFPPFVRAPSTFPPFFHLPPRSPSSSFSPFFHSLPISPPSVFPPIFHSPLMSPPPSVLPPTVPPPTFDLIPLPSPPPPPSSFPLPPFPFRPMPGFPGVPPASTSSSNKKNSP